MMSRPGCYTRSTVNRTFLWVYSCISTEGLFSNSGSFQDPKAAHNMSSAPHKGFHSPGAPLEAGVTQADHPLSLFQTRSVISDAESALTRAQPMSTTDGERTLIPSPSAEASGSSISMFSLLPSAIATPGSKFLKRKRESFADEPRLSQDINMDEEPPSQRPRTESYILDDPSGLGWFLLPFKAFVKGFKQSLTISNSWSCAILLPSFNE